MGTILLKGFSAVAENAAADATVPPNASFEAQERGKAAGWAPYKSGGKAKFDHAAVPHSGKRSVMVSSDEGGDAGWTSTFIVEPYSTYHFSGWIKTENVIPKGGKGALFNVRTFGPGLTEALTGTNDWTRLEATIDTRDSDTIQLNCVLGEGGLATGAAWFDDVSLEFVSSRDLKPEAVIDATQTGPPISRYIYGQFIEHLGRCIYGGIWAEMLEDRKFFYEVGALESPWRAFTRTQPPGAKDLDIGRNVKMATENAYVGEHVATVILDGEADPTGILQGELALRQGKEYVGRVVLAGDAEAGPVELTLAWGSKPDQRQTVTIDGLTREYKKSQSRFTVTGDTDDGQLQIVGHGKGAFRIGAVSLMPADNVQGMRADTLELLKELNAPVYRWPGGNFVSGYQWRDGMGDPDLRPPRKNPAWPGIEHNDFGLDEFMVLCRMLNTEPYIVVNAGLGDATSAAAEVEYANGDPGTPMGRLRAQNGHPDPYRVKWWGIGNEMYGFWQLGHMPLAEYVKKHNSFAEAMRAVDPTIKLIAVGATGEWSKSMLTNCAGHMDLLSEHFYCKELPGLLSHVRQIPNNVRAKAQAHRQYLKEIPALTEKSIPIAVDEWNYLYGAYLYGPGGTRYFLKDALGIAAGLQEYARNSDVFQMANYSQTVNAVGAIKTSKTAAALETTGLVLKLYRHHFGTLPIVVQGETAPLDVAAAWTENRKALTVGIVNATRKNYALRLSIPGASLTGKARVWTITGSDPMAFNEPGKNPQVNIQESAADPVADHLDAPALAVVLYELQTE
jgi:alpha-N-arabinofuranosidase